MPRHRKVVLFYPPYDGPPLGAPLCMLALASPLLEAGFEVKLVDNLTSPDFEDTILRETADALCLGISILTGPMIGSAIRIAKRIRRERPDLPIVFGGWHPSLLPAQTVGEDFVDAVVRGQGELTLLEVAERLREQKSLEAVRGVTYKEGGKAVHNPDRPVESVERLPTPTFAMADFDAYERATGVRKLPYASSKEMRS